MDSVILYAAKEQLDQYYDPINLSNGDTVWIRSEVRIKEDVETALDNAKPRKGEIVLNSIPLDPLRYK